MPLQKRQTFGIKESGRRTKRSSVGQKGRHAVRQQKGEELAVEKNKRSFGYKDIIDLPHHVSTSHPQMARKNRAAQFLPFAALSGYEDAIKETGRLTEEERDLDEGVRGYLNLKLEMLREWPEERQEEVRITYFRPDGKKRGGAYVTVAGYVKKVDDFERAVFLTDGTRIPVDGISRIEGEMFSGLED